MNILHGHHREVPHSIDIETLARFSVLVDYYDCHEITGLFANIWIKNLPHYLPIVYGRDSTIWLFVSWVFSFENIFMEMTRLAMADSRGPLKTMCLPLPPKILSMDSYLLGWVARYLAIQLPSSKNERNQSVK